MAGRKQPSNANAPKSLERPLNSRQEAFWREWLIDRNGTQAAIRAGYSPKAAHSTAHALLRHPKIQERIAEALAEVQTRMDVTLERVVQEYARIAFADIRQLFRPDGTLVPVHELTDDAAAALQAFDTDEIRIAGESVGQTRKVRMHSKVSALQDLGKYLRMFPNTMALTGPGGGPVEVAHRHALSDEELEAIASQGRDQPLT
jgi:phage terminase small subunit